MTKSLNQAFIKAYSKDKASAALRESALPKAQDIEELLVVRFDTATCSIPPTHIGETREKTAEPVAARMGPNLAHRPLAATPPNAAATRAAIVASTVGDETSELRNSIANQMLRAGEWQDQQIDAFIGGFPMRTSDPSAVPAAVEPVRQSSAIPPANSRPAEDARDAVKPVQLQTATAKPPIPPSIGPVAASKPNAVSTEPSVQPAVKPASLPQANPSAPLPVRKPTVTEAAIEKPENQKPAAQKTVSPTRPASAAPPELIPLTAPALTATARQPESAASNLTGDPQMKARLAKGEIFRLDKPSYSGHAASMELDSSTGDSGEQSSMLDVPVSDSVCEAVANQDPKVATQPAQHDSFQMERKLRQAKVRIFNPVWEVDNFQWPDVCLELLKQRAGSLEQVAQNLVGACQEGLQVLAITSAQSGEGRTTVACCLAKLAGSRGLNVAIVDGDIENPTLSYQTNLDVEQDWKTAIVNQLPLEEVAVHSIDDQVTLVPLVNPIAPHEMSTDDNRIADMLRELSESFDLVIVDMGHMNSARSLVTSLSEQGMINAVVTVVDHRYSSPQDIEACVRRIRQTGVTSIGLVENFAA